MKAEALSYFPYPVLSSIGMLLFLAVFIGAVMWTYRKAAKGALESFGALPLENENAIAEEKTS